MRSGFAAWAALLLLLAAPLQSALAQTQVADGRAIYIQADGHANDPGNRACSSCHFTGLPPSTTQAAEGAGSGHPEAANNLQLLLNAFGTGGIMTGYLGSPALDPTNAAVRDRAFKLALYIGQYKAPLFKVTQPTADPALAMTVRSGVDAVKDVYARIADDGTGGAAQDTNGLVISNTTANASAVSAAQVAGTATVAYNVSYRSVAGYTGSDSFRLTVVNPSGSAFQSIPVTVYGVTSGASAAGAKGITYTAGSPLYDINSNDPLATFSASVVAPSVAALTSLGTLSVDASGRIIGQLTAAPGTYTIRVVANIKAGTVGAANAGDVSKDVTLTVAGITSGTPPSYTQNTAIVSPYQITSNVAITANSYTLSSTPAGLSFSTSTGQISGTPTTSGVFPVTLGASTASGAISEAVNITVLSAGPPTISTTPSLPASPTAAGTVGTLFTSTQINATNPPINAGSYIATGLAATGLSVNATTGIISGTPTASGDFALTLGATNSSGPGTQNITIRINPNAVPGITSTPALAASPTVTGTVGSAITPIQINATNPPTNAGSYSADGLPGGLTVNATTGQITGAPTQSGDFIVVLHASNVVGQGSSTSVTIRINPNQVPVVTSTPALAARPAITGTVGTPISAIQINATNLPIEAGGYSADGLPGGLSVNGNTGVLSGTPTQSGDFAVVLKARNVAGTGSAASVTIRINPNQVPVISGATTAITNANQPFAGYQITASNPVILTYAVVGPSVLPAGLSLDPNTGLISGTPTASGTVSTTLRATNAAGPSSDFVLVFTIVPTSLPTVTVPLQAAPLVTGTVGSAITPIQISATNPVITGYGASGLPTGLSVNGSGQIVGTPAQSGDFVVTANATNAFGTGTSAPTTIRISPNTVPTITSAATVSRNVNAASALVYQIVASNPVVSSYAVVPPSVLPAGLTLNTTTGAISGSPTVSGISTTTLSATNVAGTSAPFVLTFTINPTSVPVVTAAVPVSPAVTGTVNSAITPIQVIATNPAISAYGASGLPGGLLVNPGTGVLSGTPTQSGDFAVAFTATNVVGTGTSATVTMRINPSQVPVISSAATISTTVNQPFGGYQIVASNLPIASYAVVAPSALPAGLTLNTTTGAISGTSTASGVVATTLRATNAAGNSAPFVLTFTTVPTSVPVVSAPFVAAPVATGTVGTPITAIQVNATNPAISGYGQSGLPPGLSIHPTTGLITGTPTTSGDFAVTLTATNAAGQGTSTPVTLRINPNTMPVVNSAGTATATANAVFGGYQITATNGPLLSYGVVTPSTLPAGLTLNTSTGAISGTPTASGSFSTSLTATNAAGTSAPLVLAFTIAPSSTPAITSPTFATVAAGVAITPIQVVATNPAILGYGATSLPPGLVINTATGAITGTPTTPGTYSAVITATNAVGPGSLIVPFTIGIPPPGTCAMAVPLNTATTLDLASCLFAGFAPTGVSIVATASHGTAVANGTKVTYTPVRNYFGSDTFSFVGIGAGGTSPQGVVSVTVTGRPDPTQDAVVTAVIAAQAETAQRFSRAQISNFQRRMESLHRRPGPAEGAAASLQQAPAGGGFAAAAALSAPAAAVASTVPAASVAPAFAGQGAVVSPGPVAAGPFPGTDHQQGRPGQTISESAVIDAVATGMGLKALPFADSVFSLIKTRSVNLASVASGMGLTPTVPGSVSSSTNYWIEGVASFGTRDASGGFSGSEFSSNGISVGVDRRFGDQWALGMGAGYARDTTTIGTDGSSNKSKGYSLAVYGSYQPSPDTFIDGLLGIGSLDFDTKRFVAPINDFAFGQRGGTQVFGSLTGGYEFRNNNLLVSPYARVDFSSNRLRTATESGAGAYALTFFGQTSRSVQGALGVRGESVHATSYGYVVPMLRAEYRHEFQGSGSAFVGYADQPGGPRYALAQSGSGRDSLVLGLGSDFILRDGLTLSLEYQLSHSFARDSSHALRVRLSKDFDVRGLPKLLKDTGAPEGEPLDLQVEAGISHDDNVTRAKAGPDKLDDGFYSFNISRSFDYGLSPQSRVVLTPSLGGEKFRRFNGLSNISAAAEAEVQYRASSEFDEPTFGVFGKLTAQGFESSLRDGYRLSAGVSVRQALTDRINVFAALVHNRRFANSAVFETRDNALRLNFDYALSTRGTLYLGSEYRRGDIVSTGRPSLENVSIAKVFVQDDAFAAAGMSSYRFDGSTVLLTLGYNLVLGNKDSLDFSWRHVRSTPGLRPAFVTSPKNYLANQLSAVYLLRF